MYLQPLFFRKLAGWKVTIHESLMRHASMRDLKPRSTGDKIALINALSRSGLMSIECPPFSSSQDDRDSAAAVLSGIERLPGIVYSTVVCDLDSAEQALRCGANQIRLIISASENENQLVAGGTVSHSAMRYKDIIEKVRDSTSVDVCITSSFGGPAQEVVAEEEVLDLGDWFAHHGANSITLCDTAGTAMPAQVEQLCDCLAERWKEVNLGLEFHNQHGMGLVNVVAGMSVGIDRFNTTVSTPGPTGNATSTMLATPQLIALLDGLACLHGVQPAVLSASLAQNAD